jgi:hypothetical protein
MEESLGRAKKVQGVASRWTEGWTNGRTDEQNRRTNGRTGDGWMDGLQSGALERLRVWTDGVSV